MSTSASHPRLLSCALVLALVSAQCAQSPESPTGPTPVLLRGAAPQAGDPPAGDSLGTVNALGATRFMAFGDSITAGTISSFDGMFLFDPVPDTTDYPKQFYNQLESLYASQNFTVTNEGAPGEWAAQAVSSGRFAQRMATQRPQALLLLDGFNDLNNDQGTGTTVGYVQQMIELARLYNTTVFLGTMFQTCPSTSPQGQVRPNAATRIASYNSALKAMAAGRQNVHVVDVYAAFGTNNCGPDGGVGILGGDGLHPNPSGYSIIATAFATAVRNVFAVRGSYQ